MSANPLVATPAAHNPDAWEGVWIVQDVQALRDGAARGDWLDASLAGVGVALDTWMLATDPIGTLGQYGLAWCIEHIEPLNQLLEGLTGDPEAVRAHSETWKNIAESLAHQGEELASQIHRDMPTWVGEAQTAYRQQADHEVQLLGGLSMGAGALSAMTAVAAEVIAAVRLFVRDTIAGIVARLIAWAGEFLLSGGLLTPLIIEQAVTFITSEIAKVASLVRSLVSSIKKLLSEITRLRELLRKLMDLLRNARSAVASGAHEVKAAAAATRRSLRDHPIGIQWTPMDDRAFSGVTSPVSLVKEPYWLRRIREGQRWHRAQQRELDQVPGGASEVHVHKPTTGRKAAPDTWKPRGPYNRVDHYNDFQRRIISMKHTQLAERAEGTVKKYIDEVVIKYRPGTPIADVPSTPEWLVGEELRGEMVLQVPRQEKPIPEWIIQYARQRDVRIVEVD